MAVALPYASRCPRLLPRAEEYHFRNLRHIETKISDANAKAASLRPFHVARHLAAGLARQDADGGYDESEHHALADADHVWMRRRR